jgi:hypothetical protein
MSPTDMKYQFGERVVDVPSIEVTNSSETYGVITNIQVYSLHDGPGLRTLVFLKC